MKRTFAVLSFCILLSTLLAAQDNSFAQAEQELLSLTRTILDSKDQQARMTACENAKSILSEVLSKPGSFAYPFAALETLSILQDSAASFRIITGQLFVDDSTYEYYGGMQLAGDTPVFIPFSDQSRQAEDLEYDIYGAEDWPGALYYGMREFKRPQGKAYILLDSMDTPSLTSARLLRY